MSDRSSTSGDGTGVPEVDSLSGAYVLNALSDEERTLFEARMSESDDIRTEVAELNETALLLGHAVTPVTPSPALRASIMDLIGSTPQLAPLSENHGSAPAQPSPGRHASDSSGSSAETGGELLEPIPLARQRWFMRPGVLLASAAAAAALIFGGVAIGQNVATSHSPATSQAQGDVSQILSANDVAHTVSDVSTGGKATLYWSNRLQRSAIILNGVTSLPSGKTYQLWYINGKSIKSAGTVEATSNDVTQVLQGDLKKGDTVGVTVEPAGGSRQPTTKPIVAISV
jgi:anti-sigma-K factor RskA